MRIRVLKDFDYTPPSDRRTTFALLAGQEVTTKREVGEAAVAAGAAEEIEAPAREVEGGEAGTVQEGAGQGEQIDGGTDANGAPAEPARPRARRG